jgi:hypothetical protein
MLTVYEQSFSGLPSFYELRDVSHDIESLWDNTLEPKLV